MIRIVKLIIWVVGLIVVTAFVLNYFGYEINMNYFSESRVKCQEKLNQCGKNLIQDGTKNAKCDFDCVNPKLIIKRK
jgi:hypothetical protein